MPDFTVVNPTDSTNIKTEEGFNVPPSTPKKRVAPKANDQETTPTKKAKATPKAKAKSQKIPDRVEDLTPQDAMVIEWREVGKTWGEIDKKWEEMTGTAPAATSLRKRYGYLKANLARVKDEDLDTLKTSMANINERIEEQKRAIENKRYAMLAEAMEEAGCEKYEQGTLEKAWKKIQAGDLE